MGGVDWQLLRSTFNKARNLDMTIQLTKVQIGAREGNRTLVISLEGVGALCDRNARSDKCALFDTFESKCIIGAVRMCSAHFAATQRTECLTSFQDRNALVRRRCDLRRARLPALTAPRCGDAA
jgi:hypothetical protein